MSHGSRQGYGRRSARDGGATGDEGFETAGNRTALRAGMADPVTDSMRGSLRMGGVRDARDQGSPESRARTRSGDPNRTFFGSVSSRRLTCHAWLDRAGFTVPLHQALTEMLPLGLRIDAGRSRGSEVSAIGRLIPRPCPYLRRQPQGMPECPHPASSARRRPQSSRNRTADSPGRPGSVDEAKDPRSVGGDQPRRSRGMEDDAEERLIAVSAVRAEGGDVQRVCHEGACSAAWTTSVVMSAANGSIRVSTPVRSSPTTSRLDSPELARSRRLPCGR